MFSQNLCQRGSAEKASPSRNVEEGSLTSLEMHKYTEIEAVLALNSLHLDAQSFELLHSFDKTETWQHPVSI